MAVAAASKAAPSKWRPITSSSASTSRNLPRAMVLGARMSKSAGTVSIHHGADATSSDLPYHRGGVRKRNHPESEGGAGGPPGRSLIHGPAAARRHRQGRTQDRPARRA